MSTTYTDLTETKFPNAVDDLSRMSDLASSDLTLVNQYYTYYNAGNLTAAAQLLADNPTLINKLFNAAKFNTLRDALISLERYYLSDVQAYIDSTKDSLQDEIDSGMAAIRADMAILDARIRAERINKINQSYASSNSQEGDEYDTMKDEALFRLKPTRGFDQIVNFRINDSGHFEKRAGTALSTTLSARIRGAISVTTADSEIIYLVCGSSLYRVTFTDGTPSAESLGTLTGAVFMSQTERAELFMFAGSVCVLGGGNLYAYDGTSVSVVDGYVPLIQRMTNRLGVGTSFERVNLLTNKVRARFVADGSTRDFRINYKVVSVDAVYVAGTQLETSKYSVSIYERFTTVTTTSVYTSNSDEDDIVEIWFTLSKDSERSRITSCKKAVAYGGDTDSRIFLYGGNESATLFPSEPSGADSGQKLSYDYYPSGGQITVGDGNLPVTGACRQRDRLAIFTNDVAFYTQSHDTTVNDLPTQTFPLNLLSPDYGATTAGGAVRCGDAMFWINNGSLYSVNSTLTKDQTQFIKKIPPAYLEFGTNSESLKLFGNEPDGEIWCYGVGNKVAVYNIKRDCWYRFEGFEATEIFSYGGAPAYYKGTGLYLASPNTYADNGVNYTAYCETGWLDFGDALAMKRIRRLGIKVGSGSAARALTVKLTASHEPVKAIQSSAGSSTSLREVGITFNIPAAESPMVCTARGQLGKVSCAKVRIIAAANGTQSSQIEELAMIVGGNPIVIQTGNTNNGDSSGSDSDESST